MIKSNETALFAMIKGNETESQMYVISIRIECIKTHYRNAYL